MKNFEHGYAQFYDQMHASKDYIAEAKKIFRYISENSTSLAPLKILDFGCGTGKHLNELRILDNEIELFGFDKSAEMIALARASYPKLEFASSLQSIPQDNNVAYSLFDVLNYQVTEQDLSNFFSSISTAIASGGILLLDSWNYGGLKVNPPQDKTRDFVYLEKNYRRKITVSTNTNYKITDLNISVLDVSTNMAILDENHRLRAFEPEEIASIASQYGFGEITFRNAEDWTSDFVAQDWKFFMVAKKL